MTRLPRPSSGLGAALSARLLLTPAAAADSAREAERRPQGRAQVLRHAGDSSPNKLPISW